MSCSLCRVPFTASSRAVFPRPPPPGLLTERERHYLQYAVLIGKTVPGGCITAQFFDSNMFGNLDTCPIILNVQWESEGGTIVALHTVCATIMRHMFNAPDYSPDSLTALCSIDHVLGLPQGGVDAGRFPHINYESIGARKDRVDLRPFWITECGAGMNAFDWDKFTKSGLAWVLRRPGVFPRFYNMLSPIHLGELRSSSPSLSPSEYRVSTRPADRVSGLPVDILHVLLPFLLTRDMLSFLSTCRALRSLALTAFQSHARSRVCALGWAVPLPSEYARASADVQAMMASAEKTNGDWMLYLSQVHRAPGMRVRRRVWALAEEVRRVYMKRVSECESGYDHEVGGAKEEGGRKAIEKVSVRMSEMALILNGIRKQ